MSSAAATNRNRAHAVQQLKKGIKNVGDEQEMNIQSAIANALIYIGDMIAELIPSADLSDLDPIQLHSVEKDGSVEAVA